MFQICPIYVVNYIGNSQTNFTSRHVIGARGAAMPTRMSQHVSVCYIIESCPSIRGSGKQTEFFTIDTHR